MEHLLNQTYKLNELYIIDNNSNDGTYEYIESFIESQDATGTGKKRTYYRITELGTQYYREKCEEWALTKDVVEHFIMEGE